MGLTAEEIALLEACALAVDRIGYYSILIKKGDLYARLALDVVTSETMSGRAANQYFLDEAARELGDKKDKLTPEFLAQIGVMLMREDFKSRMSETEKINISSRPIADYHASIYALFVISANAWTPNFVYQLLPDQISKDSYWASLVGARDWALEGFRRLIAPLHPIAKNDGSSFRFEEPGADEWYANVGV